MGKLVTLNEVGLDATWYFSDAWLDSVARRYRYEWPSENFPNIIQIHQDQLFQNNNRKIQIRRWIESNVAGPVITDIQDLSYKKYYGKSYEWDKNYTVNNAWYRFHFENSEDALAFSLIFNEYIVPVTKWHPKRPEDEAYLALPEDKRYQE